MILEKIGREFSSTQNYHTSLQKVELDSRSCFDKNEIASIHASEEEVNVILNVF